MLKMANIFTLTTVHKRMFSRRIYFLFLSWVNLAEENLELISIKSAHERGVILGCRILKLHYTLVSIIDMKGETPVLIKLMRLLTHSQAILFCTRFDSDDVLDRGERDLPKSHFFQITCC